MANETNQEPTIMDDVKSVPDVILGNAATPRAAQITVGIAAGVALFAGYRWGRNSK